LASCTCLVGSRASVSTKATCAGFRRRTVQRFAIVILIILAGFPAFGGSWVGGTPHNDVAGLIEQPWTAEEPSALMAADDTEAAASKASDEASLTAALLGSTDEAGFAMRGQPAPSEAQIFPRRKKPRDLRKQKIEPFGLVETMPLSYALAMFGTGAGLMLLSAGLGYRSRDVRLYTEGDPASHDNLVQRPLAPLVVTAVAREPVAATRGLLDLCHAVSHPAGGRRLPERVRAATLL
jgi:hypothetical protein